MPQATPVLLILAGTVALFAIDRLRDLVALLSLLALVATGALSTTEALLTG